MPGYIHTYTYAHKILMSIHIQREGIFFPFSFPDVKGNYICGSIYKIYFRSTYSLDFFFYSLNCVFFSSYLFLLFSVSVLMTFFINFSTYIVELILAYNSFYLFYLTYLFYFIFFLPFLHLLISPSCTP